MSNPNPRTAASYARSATDCPRHLVQQHTVNAERALADGYLIPAAYRFGECGSGLDPDRPALQSLLRAIEGDGGPRRIYVSSPSRLARCPRTSYYLWARFEAAGVEVVGPTWPTEEVIRFDASLPEILRIAGSYRSDKP